MSTARPPPPPGLPSKVVPVPPNQTLYVSNLPSAKIKKDDLRTALYLLFSTYGPVLDVVALKTMKMRGQAHIVFRDVQTATQAMRSLEGFPFFGHDLKISYAKSKSNVISRLDGTFKAQQTAAQIVEVTDLQQSIFSAPVPGSSSTPAPTASAPVGAAVPPSAAAAGQKRTRDDDDEEEDSDSDVAMEEDSDDE
ncbi:rna recognition domain-containing protein [Ophiostoma piceae UAMH 11346]|uniref:Rna recognition domain-containing protein n=1 Tax=Ophiostoma piceae (strain UAMH 11346) TaxID=1262450 RepID=S3C193_OPHP1|nr:rna recognition domain-containing protein [Ophiostoma piceae UAMH 11346]